jgi:hypothetical protein
MEQTSSRLVRWCSKLVSFILYFVLAILAGSVGVKFSYWMWPMIERAKVQPKAEDFCGRYYLFLDSFWEDWEPDSWIDFQRDGTCVLHRVFSGREDVESETGRWEFGGRVSVEITSGSGGRVRGYQLMGERAPYTLESWDEKSLHAERLFKDPKNSPVAHELRQVSTTDYVIQIVMLFCVFVLPLVQPIVSARIAVNTTFVVTLAWGIWRLVFFDSVTGNDVVGGAYLMQALIFPLIARGVYGARSAIWKWWKGRAGVSAPSV